MEKLYYKDGKISSEFRKDIEEQAVTLEESSSDVAWDWVKQSVLQALETGGLEEISEAQGIVRAAYVLGDITKKHKFEALDIIFTAKVGGTNGQKNAIDTARRYGWYQKEESDD